MTPCACVASCPTAAVNRVTLPSCGCPDLRSRQVCVGRRLLRLRLSKLGLSVFPLRLENIDLPFGDHLGSLSRGERCCVCLKLRRRLLSPLRGTRAFFDKVLIAGVLLL
jgi:hypothetical protein